MPYTTVIIFTAFDPLPAADLNSNFSNLDYLNNKINSQIILPASAFYPSATQGCTAGTHETTTNKNNYNFLDFADGAYSYAETVFPLPSDYNGGTLIARFIWTANSTSGNSVVWVIEGVCRVDDDPLDVAFGTFRSSTDANKTTAYDVNISPNTLAITLGGTPAASELVNLRIARAGSDAADTLAATARLIAVVLDYTRS